MTPIVSREIDHLLQGSLPALMRHVAEIAAAAGVDADRVVALVEEATWFAHDHAVTGRLGPVPLGDATIRRAVGRAVVRVLERADTVNGGRIAAAWQLAWGAVDAPALPIDDEAR